MKKIMTVLAAAVAVANVYAGACSVEPVKETAWVYHWKFTGKTTNPAKAKVSTKSYSACSVAPKTCSIRVPSSLKIEGYTYFCSPGCGDSFTEVTEVNEVFWMKKPSKESLAGGVATEIMNIIGKKAKSTEIAGTAKFNGDSRSMEFTYAGIGKYSPKYSRITSASGNFAGISIMCDCAASHVWDCSTLSIICDENPPTVVYGKWSVKFKKDAAKKYLNYGRAAKMPSWVQWKNRD